MGDDAAVAAAGYDDGDAEADDEAGCVDEGGDADVTG